VKTNLSVSDFIKIFETIAETLEREKDYLSELDGAIGDGDHGVNMAKCFREVRKKLAGSEEADIGALLDKVGKVILNAVGGAMGALYGTFFLKASKEAKGKREVGLEDLIRMFEAAEAAIVAMGKARPGDKTLLDTLDPALKALKEAQAEGKPLLEALAAFSEAARKGAESTQAMIAKIGRSSRLGERTIGHQDAGATSCYFILNAFYQATK
jgi:dihydroxyacetone kinase-like protein